MTDTIEAAPPPRLDERVQRKSPLARLFARPEAGALAGAIQFAVDQQPYLQGYESIDALWLYKTNDDVLGGAKTVLTGPAFIDSSNVAAISKYAARGTR